MERYLKNSSINNLIKLAHELEDKYNISELEELISIAHDVRANTLSFDLPGDFILKDLISLCFDNKITFAVIGGMAISAYAMPRKTEDIDILVNKLPDNSDLRDADYMNKFNFYRGKSSTGTVLTLDHKRNGQIEMLVADSPIKKYALETAIVMPVLKINVPVVSAAALIGLKAAALADNPSRDAKDSTDILNVWKNNHPDLSEIKTFLPLKAIQIIEKYCL
jgi:hypothetical protein